MVRSVGVKKDIRFYRSETYGCYWFLSMHSFLGKRGDSYDRFLIRVREMYESINIIFQILSNLTILSSSDNKTKTSLNHNNKDFFSFFDFLYKKKLDSINRKTKFNSMENLIKHFKKYSEGVTIKKGFSYNSVEAPKGEFGVSLVSDGTSKPFRCKIRTPAYHHMHIMPRMVQGHFMADLVTVLGSQDIVFGDVDR